MAEVILFELRIYVGEFDREGYPAQRIERSSEALNLRLQELVDEAMKAIPATVLCAMPDGADIGKRVTAIVHESIRKGRLHGAALKDGRAVAVRAQLQGQQ